MDQISFSADTIKWKIELYQLSFCPEDDLKDNQFKDNLRYLTKIILKLTFFISAVCFIETTHASGLANSRQGSPQIYQQELPTHGPRRLYVLRNDSVPSNDVGANLVGSRVRRAARCSYPSRNGDILSCKTRPTFGNPVKLCHKS
jgi:hypothetical protein